MTSSVLPAYSLRVQLFSPRAHALDDKPIRNFRVVTSPKITVSEFCEEASRIHEINYGYALAIKKVQDDQAFDITQNEILGSIFIPSSIIRVVQASTQPDIRDSVPPDSALRFEPSISRKRGRRESIEINRFSNSGISNKRPKIPGLDPDNPLPSREINAGLLKNVSQSQESIPPRRSSSTEPRNSRIAPLQIPETPEPTLVSHSKKPAVEFNDFNCQGRQIQSEGQRSPDKSITSNRMEKNISNLNQEVSLAQHGKHAGKEGSSTKLTHSILDEEYVRGGSVPSVRLTEPSDKNLVNVEQTKEGSVTSSQQSIASDRDLTEYQSPILSNKINALSSTPSTARNKKRKKLASKSIQNLSSSPSQGSPSDTTPPNEGSNPMQPQDNRKVSFLGDREQALSKLSTRLLSNCHAKPRAKEENQAANIDSNSNPQLYKSEVIPHMKSCTPILPPKRKPSQSTKPPKKKILEENYTPATTSKVVSSNKIIPTKVTPIIPPNKKRLVRNNPSQDEHPTKKTAPVEDKSKNMSSEGQEIMQQIKTIVSSKDNGQKIVSDQGDALLTSKMSSQSQLNEIKKLGAEMHDDQGSEDEEVETHSKDSTERDSRSPISFHRTPHPSEHQRSPTLSSDTHSDTVGFKDLEMPDDVVSKFSSENNVGEGRAYQQCFEISESCEKKNQKIDSEAISTSERNNAREIRSDKEETANYSSKIQILNSSPPTHPILPSHQSGTSTGSKKQPNNLGQITSRSTPVRGPPNLPSSPEIRKPHFAFGASLTAMHQNGRIVSQSRNTKNLQNPSTLSAWDKVGSYSGSENSDSDSQASSTEDEALPVSQSQVTHPLPSSDSDSDDSETQETKALQLAKQEAKEALVAKIKGLTHSQPSSDTGNNITSLQVQADNAAESSARRRSLRNSVSKGNIAVKKRSSG